MKSSFSMHRLFTRLFHNKRFTIPFSLIVAFSFWIILKVSDNPDYKQVFWNVPLSISVDDTVISEMGLGIVSDVSSQKFTVTIKGPSYVVSSLRPEDFQIKASLTEVNAAGTYSLRMEGVRTSSKTGYEFSSISPATIDVTFDYFDTKQFTVTPRLIGVSAVEGLIVDTPVMADSEQNTITVKGPRSVMEKIDAVGTYAEVNKTLSVSQTFDAGIVFYNADGGIIYRYDTDGKIYDAKDNQIESTYLTASFFNAKVTAPIVKKAVVQVKPTFTHLPDGLLPEQIVYRLDHETVTVTGTPDTVDANTVLKLAPIDFWSVSPSSTEFEVSLTMPDGMKLTDNIETFHVSLDLSGYTEKIFTVTDIRTTNLTDGLTAKTAVSIRNVKVCGPSEVLATLKNSQLYATVDLSDKTVGAHTVDAVVKCTDSPLVWQVGNYSTTVTLSGK
ncbi:MAG: hypothetical protein IKI29_03080 [Clostridia bacterium]|nr:hypothetical protein [Clostridia bacterium]